MSTINISATDPYFYADDPDNSTITISGQHGAYIGTGNTVTALGGGNSIFYAEEGNNIFNLAADHDDVLYLGGGHNTVLSTGTNATIYFEGGTGDVLTMPTAGHGFDSIVLLSNAVPSLDFRAALAGTSWDGKVADLGSYIKVTQAGAESLISVVGRSGSSFVGAVSNLGYSPWTEATVLAHAIT